MNAFLSKNPLLLLLDDVHNGDPEALGHLFDCVQRCMRSKLPLAMIIAATDSFGSFMYECKTEYMDKSNFLELEDLSRDEASAALEVPATNSGRPITRDALDVLLDWCDNFPIFINMAGEHAWDFSARRGGSDITLEDANSGLRLAEDARNEYYGKLIDELEGAGLLHAAVRTTELISRDSGHLRWNELANGIIKISDGMDRQSANKVICRFIDAGLLRHGGIDLEPGIPSILDYVKSNRLSET